MIPTSQNLESPLLQYYKFCEVNKIPLMTAYPFFSNNSLHNFQIQNLPYIYDPRIIVLPTFIEMPRNQPNNQSINTLRIFQNHQKYNCTAVSKFPTYQDKLKNYQELQIVRKDSQNQSISHSKSNKIQRQRKIIKLIQNKNRNIIPSVVQQIFSFLSKPNKSKIIAKKVFSLMESSHIGASIEKYFYFVKQIKQKLNHYLNLNSLSVLCSVQNHCLQLIGESQQIFYLKITRKIAKYFLDSQLPQLIIHSKRMFQDKRIEHLRVRRILTEVLQNMEC